MTCVPLDRTFILLDRTLISLDRTLIPLDRTSVSLDSTLISLVGVLPMMAYTRRLRPKGVYLFQASGHERVGISD